MKTVFITIALLLFFESCQQRKTSAENPTNNQLPLKAVEELRYAEIVNPVMSDSGEPFEYHGEPMNVEAMANVVLEATNKPCKQEDCGQQYIVKNIGIRTIKVLSYSTFQVGLLDSYAARHYILKEGEEAIIGCSSFCYNGKTYAFSHKIIGAEYIETDKADVQ